MRRALDTCIAITAEHMLVVGARGTCDYKIENKGQHSSKLVLTWVCFGQHDEGECTVLSQVLLALSAFQAQC